MSPTICWEAALPKNDYLTQEVHSDDWMSLKAQVSASDPLSCKMMFGLCIATQQYDNKLGSFETMHIYHHTVSVDQESGLTWVFCFTRLQSKCQVGLCLQAHTVIGRIQARVACWMVGLSFLLVVDRNHP